MYCAAIYVLGVVLTPILVGMFVDEPIDPVDQCIPLALVSLLWPGLVAIVLIFVGAVLAIFMGAVLAGVVVWLPFWLLLAFGRTIRKFLENRKEKKGENDVEEKEENA